MAVPATHTHNIGRIDQLNNRDLTWNFSQVFGDRVERDEEIADADIISAVRFNHDGEFLATGDRGGRVVLFERSQEEANPCEYKFYTEFQSHEAEFDYLKSLEIEEKINQIEWLRRCNSSHFLLTTNDKTIKLWKVSERPVHIVTDSVVGSRGLSVPKSHRTADVQTEARQKRTYANAHTYHINSISVNSDDETFLSADDLRINLWHTGIGDNSFNIVDIKPENMEELQEVITAAQCHPLDCHVFMYGSSRGSIKLGDMRASALCDRHSKMFEMPVDEANKSFFSEIISSVSDVKFSHDGRYIMSRDYLTIKIWDTRNERRPVSVYNVHDYLKPKLCDLYENDSIFDKFEACWSGDDSHVMTGSYNNHFHIFGRESQDDVILQASRDAIEGPHHVLNPVQVVAGKALSYIALTKRRLRWLESMCPDCACCSGSPSAGTLRYPHRPTQLQSQDYELGLALQHGYHGTSSRQQPVSVPQVKHFRLNPSRYNSFPTAES
eukprot:TRINITY_DN6061_c0_g1_i2.p1 TRINITY_DN6061_c0_g1~~TRINITY_DN6061_c0_g1_i2.p1  ORF type:complete len:542 (+),score=68.80 TRINITY_DN6061_c0_g1_i2:141-1628(+)